MPAVSFKYHWSDCPGLIYDLGRKAWAKIKAQAGSDHRNCTGNGKLDHRFRKLELFQGFIYMFFLIL